MGVKVGQETPILHLGHPSKCIDWSPVLNMR